MADPEGSVCTVTRRHVLRLGAAGLCVLAPTTARSATSRGGDRKLSFHNLHTGESLTATYWADGAYVAGELSAIDRVLRDFRTGDVGRMDVRLLDLLYGLHGRMESAQPFHVISGYRSAATNAKLAQASRGVAKRSLHMRGMAIDIRLPGRRLAHLHKAAKDLRGGGVGIYSKSDFVHLDVGRVRYW